MRILILEDTDERIQKFKQKLIGKIVVICKNANECIKTLTFEPTFDYIFLDFDLIDNNGQYMGNGYDVADWIACNTEHAPNHILIHSLNNIGASKIMLRLGDVGLRAKYIPFLWNKIGNTNEPS